MPPSFSEMRRAGARVQAFGGRQDNENLVLFPESGNCVGDGVEIVFQGAVRRRTRVVKVHRTVMAVFIGAGQTARRELGYRRLHRPLKRVDRTHHQHRRTAVPAYFSQDSLAILDRSGFEGPRCVSAQLGRHAQFTQHVARLFVAGDHEGILAIARAHLRDQRVHMTGLGAVSDRKLVLRGGDTQGPDHHRGERVGKLAFEHRSFAGHHAVMLGHLVGKKRRENVRAGEPAACLRSSHR